MTLTREQVVQWAKEADLAEARDDEITLPADYVQALERLATLAFNAGRARGLGEAVEVCVNQRFMTLQPAKTYTSDEVARATKSTCKYLAAAIEQLKEKT